MPSVPLPMRLTMLLPVRRLTMALKRLLPLHHPRRDNSREKFVYPVTYARVFQHPPLNADQSLAMGRSRTRSSGTRTIGTERPFGSANLGSMWLMYLG